MYQNEFTSARAEQHRADLIADARRAHDVQLAKPGRHAMYAKNVATIATFAILASGGIAAAAASPWQSSGGSPHHSAPPHTPSQCIRLNGGDYNACNVGNDGSGDKPYLPVHALTPNDCIRLNGGDYNACNVGNSGRGDLPYQPLG
jgi:roadblock/LC7 domain-containing protein